MGPFDQQVPPMVTAQGYDQPMVAPTAAVDQSAQLAQLLRRRSLAAKQAELSAGNSQMWGSTMGQPQFTQTIRGGAGMPDQVVVNYGDILGKGVSNYMQAKERKTSVEKKAEVDEINNDFMNSTLNSDPEAAKLFGAVQAGVPGAAQALTQHLAPKKQAMAVIVQGLTTGLMDPELAAQLAPQYGLDPEVVRKAAVFSTKKKEEENASKFAEKVTLQELGVQGKKEIQAEKPTKSGYTQAELNAMPVQERIAAIQASSGRESSESKERGKLRVQAEQDMPKTDYALKNLRDVIGFASKAAYYPGNIGLMNPKITTNSNNAMLKQAIKQLVLDASGGKLGGGVSNADVKFLEGASAELDNGNRDTVVAQLNNLLGRLAAHREAMQRALGESSPLPNGVTNGPSSPFDSSNVRDMRNSGAPSFDDVWNEVNQ